METPKISASGNSTSTVALRIFADSEKSYFGDDFGDGVRESNYL
jgi:hypothetical protein